MYTSKHYIKISFSYIYLGIRKIVTDNRVFYHIYYQYYQQLKQIIIKRQLI